jgi:hypothetical protein
MMAHRQLRNRLARIQRRQADAAYNPNDLRQAWLRTLEESLPHDDAVMVVDFLCSMPRDQARAWLQAQIERREA